MRDRPSTFSPVIAADLIPRLLVVSAAGRVLDRAALSAGSTPPRLCPVTESGCTFALCHFLIVGCLGHAVVRRL
jgi:hypothetical protein